MIIEIVLVIAFLWLTALSLKLSETEEFSMKKIDLRDYVSKEDFNSLIKKLNKNETMLREYLDVEEDTILIKGEKIRRFFSGILTREPYIKTILVKKKK